MMEPKPGRDKRGFFLPGNRIAVGRGSRRDGLAFAQWSRELLSDPARRKRIAERVDRELKGDGPAPVLTKLLAYAFGEPKVIAEIDMSHRVESLATALGLDVAEVWQTAARIESGEAEGE